MFSTVKDLSVLFTRLFQISIYYRKLNEFFNENLVNRVKIGIKRLVLVWRQIQEMPLPFIMGLNLPELKSDILVFQDDPCWDCKSPNGTLICECICQEGGTCNVSN